MTPGTTAVGLDVVVPTRRRPAARATLKVLACFTSSPSVLDSVARHAGWLEVEFCAEDDQETFYGELPTVDVIWPRAASSISASDLAQAPRLKLIHKLGTGVNTIDVQAATALGIAVATMPGANAPSVAEGTVLLMLAALRRLTALDRATRAGVGWPADPSLGETVRDIETCTVGLVGHGHIAQRVEIIVAAMGATVLHTSTGDDGSAGWRSLPDLLAVSDIVSVHVPLTAATSSLLDADALTAMKPDAVLVNTSRGAIVDEAALVDALRNRRLAAAGLDVFIHEPIRPDNPLLTLDNVVLTPHVSWYTANTIRRYLACGVDNCARLRDGLELANIVNGIATPHARTTSV
jgi:phosphoglycerate dehydrogenase-like enzyme